MTILKRGDPHIHVGLDHPHGQGALTASVVARLILVAQEIVELEKDGINEVQGLEQTLNPYLKISQLIRQFSKALGHCEE